MELQLEQLQDKKTILSRGVVATVFYHSIFSFPLTREEAKRWFAGRRVKNKKKETPRVLIKNGFYFLEGYEESVYKRLMSEKFSREKLKITRKVAKILRAVPSIKAVLVTGSLAMGNAGIDSDIDLMTVTSEGTVWITRLVSYFLLKVFGFQIRKADDKNERDKLCLNIWIDEKSLTWDRKNAFTAHEIFQAQPIINRDSYHEKFIKANTWAFDFWPNAYKKGKNERKSTIEFLVPILRLVEPLAFFFQFNYMKRKMTREVVTPSKALFHPVDWNKIVKSNGF